MMESLLRNAQIMPIVPDQTPVVYVVDDDISVRESLEWMIEAEGWRPCVFASAREFLAAPPEVAPHCAILDIGLPDVSGLELQEKIVAERPETPIIFITGTNDVPMTVRAMKAGAIEFLTKPFSDEVLLAAIQGALERSAKSIEAAAKKQTIEDRYALLSGRERQVMALVVSGLMNKQVGGKLGISEITVKAHRGQVMRKMEARSLADLIGMADRLGLPR
jgi:FixJ family two-component response regulator